MNRRKKQIKILIRFAFWLFYLFSGIFLYTKKNNVYDYLSNFSKIIYPISIFWLQLRITNKENWLPITNTMTTAQLWFKLLPVAASFTTVIVTSVNFLLFFIM